MAYLDTRKKEDRIYDDEVVRSLPYLNTDHPQAAEWRLRQKNVTSLLRHTNQLAAQNILDLGCGNGWLTRQFVQDTRCQVLGLDINEKELLQAQRLFAGKQCHFAYGDVFNAALPNNYFDLIAVVSCIQYFPDFGQLINCLLNLLAPGGEIHVLDSPIYVEAARQAAQERTRQYYQQQKVPAMQQHYHHHSWEALADFNHQVLYNPKQFSNRIKRTLGQNLSPFPWILIKNQTA